MTAAELPVWDIASPGEMQRSGEGGQGGKCPSFLPSCPDLLLGLLVDQTLLEVRGAQGPPALGSTEQGDKAGRRIWKGIQGTPSAGEKYYFSIMPGEDDLEEGTLKLASENKEEQAREGSPWQG